MPWQNLLELQRNNQYNAGHRARQRENGENSFFLLCCGDRATTSPDRILFFWLCYRKWLMLFPWSSKGITGKMPYQWIQPRGKLEKKAVFSPHCGDKTTINDNRVFLFINRKLEQSLFFWCGTGKVGRVNGAESSLLNPSYRFFLWLWGVEQRKEPYLGLTVWKKARK